MLDIISGDCFITGSLFFDFFFLKHILAIPPTQVCSIIEVGFFFFLDSTHIRDHMLFIFLWLFSLNIKTWGPSLLSHMARFHSFYGQIICYCVWGYIYIYIYGCHILKIILFVYGHLVCIHILTILNNDETSMRGIYLFEKVFLIFSVKYPEVELLNVMVVLFLIDVPIHILANRA